MASIGLFGMFETMKIHSSIINWIAKSTFGIYLLHCNPYMWTEWTTRFNPLYSHSVLGVIAAVVLLYGICFVLDMVIRYAIVNPLQTLIIAGEKTMMNK